MNGRFFTRGAQGTRRSLLLLAGWLTLSTLCLGQRFLPDDPIREDPDRLPIPLPKSIELSQIADFLENTFLRRPEGEIPPAQNVNTLGEVPDSSWFTNRVGNRKVTLEELSRGPDRGSGPDTSRPWTIIRAKTEGVTPGFTIRDPRGDVYFIKFDPLENPQMATSSEVICTKFFHAFGYNVPENYLAFIRRDQLRIDPGAQVTDDEGKRRRMTEEDVDEIFRRVPRLETGEVQVVASLRLEGRPLGPFRYYGRRSDDPNDLFPHEHRRELRGLRLFAAWTNHDDARSINTLDMFTEQGYVRHYLIDFGSCFGSGSIKPQSRRAGNEYILEWSPILKAALTLGIWDRPWRRVRYPDYPSIGRFEADYFQPHRWKPEYPNPAFERMLPQDAFWAARIIFHFDDEMVRALVRTGRLQNPEAEEYLIQTLLQRRDKIVRHYFAQVNPLSDFQVGKGSPGQLLRFRNLGLEAGLSRQAVYQAEWFSFDNRTNRLQPLQPALRHQGEEIPLPDSTAEFLMVRLRTLNLEQKAWQKGVEVYLRRSGDSYQVVGIDRE